MGISSLFSKGALAAVCLVCMMCSGLQQVRFANCQTTHHEDAHVVDGPLHHRGAPPSPSSPPHGKSRHHADHARSAGGYDSWRNAESLLQRYGGGGGGGAVGGQIAAPQMSAAGPIAVRGGTVLLRPLPAIPEGAGDGEGYATDDDDNNRGAAVGPVVAADFGTLDQWLQQQHAGPTVQGGGGGGPFGLLQLQHQAAYPQQQPWSSLLQIGAPGPLQRMLLQLFGRAAAAASSSDDGHHASLCGRVTAVGRLLARLLEPLFTTGFFVAAQYFFARSVLPRLAHYVHAYTTSTTTVDDRANGGGAAAARSGRGHSPFADLDALTAGVRDAIDGDAPCLRKMACEAGLQLAGNPIAHTISRMAEQIILKYELTNIFNESFTGSVSECDQYKCEPQS